MALWMSAAALWAVLQLLLLSWPVRVVRWPTVLLAFGVGAYGCGVASVLLELVVARQVAGARHQSLSRVMEAVSWTTAPVAEELIKLAPLMAAGWVLRRRMQWGLSDFAVLGGATGAGFGLLEAVLTYAGAGGRAVSVADAGGWRIPVKLIGQPYVPGPSQILGHWFPAASGTLDSGQVALPYELHVVASVLGGLGVGLLWCGGRPLSRAAGLLPIAAGVGAHGVYNYSAVFAESNSAEWWREGLTQRWGLWIVLGCLAFAWGWGVRRLRVGAAREPAALIAAERQGRGAGQALLAYAWLRPPATWIIALGYAHHRRALCYASAHPRSDPQRLEFLRELVTGRAARMDQTATEDAWRGLTLRRLWAQARARRTRLPRHEKALLLLTALLAVPSLAYLAVGSFPAAQGVQEYFTDGTGLRLLVGAALAGLALAGWRLVAAVHGYRSAAAQPLGETVAVLQFRIAVCAGSLVVGALLLYRWEAIAGGADPLEAYRILGRDGFLLERLLQVGLPLLLTVALFAMPYALPLELLMGGGLAESLLWAAAPRVLSSVAARTGAARLAARGAMPWIRGALARGRGPFSRGLDRIRHARTDPVDLATGRMFLTQDDAELPGVLPLVFSRRVDSGYRAGNWFGPGWVSTVDQRLEFDEQGVVFITEDSLLLPYPHPVPGGPPVQPAEGGPRPLTLGTDGTYTVTDPGTGHTRAFTLARPGAGTALLRWIADRNGNRITLGHGPDDAPSELVHSSGQRLLISTRDGRITALTHDGTRLRSYGYDAVGNLTEITGASGQPLRFGYDTAGRITSWTDTNNRSYTYTYDDRDRVVAEGGDGGHFTCRLDYDGAHPDFPGHRITTLTAGDGTATRHVIDGGQQVVAEIDADGAVTRTAYDHQGRTVAETDALGRTTGYRYDSAGRLTSVIRPDGGEISIERDPHGNPVRVAEPGGATWRQTWDARGNRTSVTDPAGETTRYAYDDRGALHSVTDPLGATTYLRCDAAGLPLAVIDPLGATTGLRRDASGRVVAQTDPLGAVTRYQWDPDGRLLSRTGPDGAVESWTYDGEGNCTTHTTPAGAVTRFAYGHFDQLTGRTEPDGAHYEFSHDAELRLTRVTNPAGLAWSYAYDPVGCLAQETDFDGRTTRYEHDPAGRLTTWTTPLGHRIRYEYDVLDRPVRQDAEGTVTEFTYDPAGNLVRAAGAGTELTRTHDPVGRLLTETVEGRTLGLTYDRAGHLIARTTPSGTESTYTYDVAGNRTALTTAGRTLTATLDGAGRETRREWTGTGVALDTVRDPTGRPLGRHLTGPGGSPLLQRTYTWRSDGHLTATGDRRYALDPMGRVTAVAAEGWTESYAYDLSGNQAHAAWPGSHPGADAAGPRTTTGTRVTSAGAVHYEYDAAGRTTMRRRTRLSRTPEIWHYTWDEEDRLTEVVTPDGTRWCYRYDPLGRRTSKQRLAPDGRTVAEETRFTWHEATLVEQTTHSTDRSGEQTLTWEHDETGLTPLTQTARHRPAADTPQSEIDTRFYAIVTDLVGTPTELVDETGEFV
ncbi:DUF6531 domain-containing protein [Streptomyces sp. NPDC058045]|uniref:DUF6531 domain-containing protein n=1 Tax=Streptomyces sp. NPDC058045 TaxID=3346311 RepID=UPI0036E06763